ncbi:ribosomal RNA-processing protein 7 homolog A [Drosophila persimilis]|uniref:Ribosomal RNA-processing protein 7 homolog A n=1 Tax=Drosophila pseudoobscura pseudoobscura TaxID=46245 RepID=Q29PM6_DROPS|nr:ribosomal RNA-processing protein 7 homolog A [Drosophila pseudoobscura]XP_026845016.1 ribosomal RNA-processing protein 7 homolog A [Drosophila persimilis]
MEEIEGYTVVPLRMSSDALHCHSVYMREHFIRLMDPNKPKGRTLFLLNIPPYVTEESLKGFFKRAGNVESVQFAAKPGKDETIKWYEGTNEPFSNVRPPFIFKVAYVVFQKSSSIGKALAVPSIDLFHSSGESTIKTGMELWHEEYENHYILDAEKTKAQITEYMADYDRRERAAALAAKNSEADADGWVTVGKEGRNAGFEQKESVIGRLEKKRENDTKTKELKNFYTFQIRESKMQNIVEMRKKFEEDKRKIELLKQSRRFKPF